jgi:hypothetical protein
MMRPFEFSSAKDTSALCAKVHCRNAFNYSLVHADVPFLYDMTIVNSGTVLSQGQALAIALSGYARTEPVSIPKLPPRGSYRVVPLPQFGFERRAFRDLLEPDKIPLEVWISGERLV